MYTFEFSYADGRVIVAEHITSVSVHRSDGIRAIDADQILTTDFSLYKDLSLHSHRGNHSISCQDLRSIQIEAE